MFFVGNAGGAIVIDVFEGDANMITSATPIFDPEYSEKYPRTGVNIVESYGENTCFDKLIEIEASDDWANGWSSMYVNFQVTNDTNFAWSGYRLEFWNQEFTQKYPITLLAVNTSPLFGNDIFEPQTDIFYGTDIVFGSETAQQNPGETNNVWFRWDWGNPGGYQEIGTILGVRQIAEIPVPGAVWFSIIGMTGIVAIRRIFRG